MAKITNACLNKAIENGNIDEATKRRIIEKARELAPKGRKGIFNRDNIDNDGELLKKAAQEIQKEKQKEKMIEALTLKKQTEVINNFIKAYDTLENQGAGLLGKNTKIDNNKRAVLAAASILGNIGGFRMTGVKGAAEIAKSTQQVFNSRISELYSHYNGGLFQGKIREANDLNFLKEMYNRGDSGEPEMTKLAEIWEEANKFYIDSFNAAGGNIKFNKDWRVPQSHKQTSVRKAGLEQWIKDIKDKLDWEKMTDAEGNYIPPEKRDAILTENYETITTNGLNKQTDPIITDTKVEGIKQGNGVSIRNKYQEERFLIFKDAESQFNYNAKYGEKDIMTSIFNHVNNIGYEVGLMEALGPKLGSSLEIVKQLARKRGAEDKAGGLHLIDGMWNILTKNGMEVANPAVANFFTLLRGNAVVQFIGSILPSAIADIPNSIVAARKFGLTKTGEKATTRLFTQPMKVLKGMAQQTDTLGQKGKELQIRRNGNINSLLFQNSNNQRFVDVADEFTHTGAGGAFSKTIGALAEGQQNLNNHLYKYSFLTDFTESGKNAAINEIQDMLATYRDVKWNDIPEDIKKGMIVAGFNEQDLLLLKKADLEDVGGYETLTINSIMKSKNLNRTEKLEAVTALNTFGNTYANYAIPEINEFQKAMVDLGGKAGSIPHETLKTILQFKSFPITFFHNQLMGDFRNTGGRVDFVMGIGMRAAFGISFGILSVQMAELSKGKTLKEFTDADWQGRVALMTEGWLKAGGLGILGDFVFRDWSKFNSNFGEWLLGPTGSKLNDFLKGTGKGLNTLRASLGYEVEGQTFDLDGGSFADIVDYGLDYGNLWYTKAVVHQAVDAFLRKEFDPNYQKEKKEREKRLAEQGQEYWIKDIFE